MAWNSQSLDLRFVYSDSFRFCFVPVILANSKQGEWLATGVDSNTKFAAIDLSEEWYDYDEKAGDEVSVKDMKWEIRRN